MNRALRRRRERAAKKGRLCADDARFLDKMRRLPNFPQTFDDNVFPIWTVDEQVRPILALIRKNRRVQVVGAGASATTRGTSLGSAWKPYS